MSEGQRRLAAIMFTDLAGYTSLAQKDEPAALSLLQEHRQILRSVLPRYAGMEIKTMGDAFLIEFSSALQATRCAIEIQRTLRERNQILPLTSWIRLRIGIHVGDIIHEKADIIGDGVNLASRIEPLAEPGGICVTQQVFDQVHNKLDARIVEIGMHRLKHVATPLNVYKVDVDSPRDYARATQEGQQRIAVLPLASVSPETSDEYFSDGMTDELISTLSKIAGLSVIARTSVMRYKGAPKSIAEIGRELNVQTVVEGSVRKARNKLRITVQLVDAQKEEPLWSKVYDRHLDDIFAIQSNIAHQVARALKVQLLRSEEVGIGKKATQDTEAYMEYLRGRYFWNKRSEESLRRAVKSFQLALEKDKGYALAYAGLSDSYAAQALLELLPPRKAFPKAKESVLRALRIDPDLAEARTSLGLIKFQYEGDWSGSEKEFKRAIALNSNYAPAHHFYADLLKAMGRFDEALNEIKLALWLDPLSLAINTGVGHVLYLSRQYDRAIEQYRRTVELDSNFVQTHLWFGRPYLQKRMYSEAIAEVQKAVDISGRNTMSLAVLGHAYAASGNHTEARGVLKELRARAKKQYVPSYWIALIHVGLGDKDQAFAWLQRAYKERSSWLAWVKVEPRFDVLRSDRRFLTLLKKMKLS